MARAINQLLAHVLNIRNGWVLGHHLSGSSILAQIGVGNRLLIRFARTCQPFAYRLQELGCLKQKKALNLARPSALTPLFRSLRSFKGVGPALGTLMDRFFGQGESEQAVALDLLMHMPSNIVDRRAQTGIAGAEVGQIATLLLHIDKHQPPPRGKNHVPHRVLAHDETGDIQLIFFRAKGGWVERALPEGEQRYVSGEIGIFGSAKQMTHPDYMVEPDKFDTLPLVETLYPLTHGLSSKVLRRLIGQVVESLPTLGEWIPASRSTDKNWPDFASAMRQVHTPSTPTEADISAPARTRLAYDEYLAGQLALQLVRRKQISVRGRVRNLTGEKTKAIRAALPFSLTNGQEEALGDILGDLTGKERMARLLQGDVGSGKTIVGLLAMAAMAEDGAQSAFMAPTELLANQHYATLKPLCDAAGLSVALLTGKMPAKERRVVAEAAASGELDIAVGTHALFQADVNFANLGLVVVDEQHRFGVHQRLALSSKGQDAELLVMTATPIPRTLVLTHFGDMAVSILREKPAGRQPIDTASLPVSQVDRVVARLQARIAEGAQAYWVCPLVEESELVPLMSAEDRHASLQTVFGDQVALLHGRMKSAEKAEVMGRFQSGEVKLLVATTVIEVGVDVPNATIMVIEHAERFGLSQLHQLRGRVGRGSERSACLLLHKEHLGETAQARIDTIKNTEDGFEIAERDLELRGQGDVLGTRQSGMPGYHIAVPDVHRHLLEFAHTDAKDILKENPELSGETGAHLRTLLYVFRKDLAIPLLRAG